MALALYLPRRRGAVSLPSSGLARDERGRFAPAPSHATPASSCRARSADSCRVLRRGRLTFYQERPLIRPDALTPDELPPVP